jgi:hypothetical protein
VVIETPFEINGSRLFEFLSTNRMRALMRCYSEGYRSRDANIS